jgi:hypothetical protein
MANPIAGSAFVAWPDLAIPQDVSIMARNSDDGLLGGR